MAIKTIVFNLFALVLLIALAATPAMTIIHWLASGNPVAIVASILIFSFIAYGCISEYREDQETLASSKAETTTEH